MPFRGRSTSSEVHSELCQISKMEHFEEIINGYKALTIFEKLSILDVWQSLKYASASYTLFKYN